MTFYAASFFIAPMPSINPAAAPAPIFTPTLRHALARFMTEAVALRLWRTMKPYSLSAFAATSLLVTTATLCADVKLPFVFSDHMVLQRDRDVPVWGWADPGATVDVTFAGQAKTAIAAADGQWMVRLDPLQASDQGRSLTVASAGRSITLDDVLVGEVWICSGQSNMEKPLGEQRGQLPTVNSEAEIAAANHPQIRFLALPKTRDAAIPSPIDAKWVTCTPQSIESTRFSAVGYFFGRSIHRELNVPVGLIGTYWGGTRIEPWTPPEGFEQVETLTYFAPSAASDRPTKVEGIEPAVLYKAMVRPLVPFALRGVLWYQGESNLLALDGPRYTEKMQALVGGWRTVWGQGDFPFYFVQLAPYAYSARPESRIRDTELPIIWQAQTQAAQIIPNSAMVVTTDLVDNLRDIHPVRKREVGERLALVALARTYGRPVVDTGPSLNSVRIDGPKAIVSLDFAQGLTSRDDQPLTWFELAGPDGRWKPASASLDGDTVILTADGIQTPTQVRFAWHESAMPNLTNAAGLPAVPFRWQLPQ